VGLAAVGERVLEHRRDDLMARPFVISGLRTLEEVALLLNELPDVTVVLIEAPPNQRWQRNLERGRPGRTVLNRADFRTADHSQDAFGLLPVARDIADVVIANTSDLQTYLRHVGACVAAAGQNTSSVAGARRRRPPTRLARALACLADGRPVTLPQIEEEAGLGAHNASRFFSKAPLTVTNDRRPGGPFLWSITPTGRAYLQIVGGSPV